MEIGILLDTGTQHPDELTEWAVAAEARGVAVAVVTRTRRPGRPPWNPWTVASWIVGRTTTLRVGVIPLAPRGSAFGVSHPDHASDESTAMISKARETLGMLAPGRLLAPETSWLVAPPDVDVDTLTNLAENGIPLITIASAGDLDRAGALADEVRNRPAPPPRRSAAALAARQPGIDYDAVPASLAATAVEPGDAAYRSVSSTYLRGGAPGLVLRPGTAAEVADALAFARAHRGVPLGVRSAGHGISGRSTNRGGLVIHVGGMTDVHILDRRSRRVRVGPGATWKKVARALAPHGLAIGSGDYGGVGVGGLATAGGIGLLSREHGLTIDRATAIEVVLADGTHVRTTRAENPDLFWAMRGAGANFGVATAFEFEASEIGEIGWAQLTLVTADIEHSLHRFGELATAAPRDTTVFLVTGRAQNDRFVLQLFGIVDNPDPDTVVERLTPFLELGMLARHEVVMTTYDGVMANAADIGPEGQQGFGEPVSRSAFIPALTAQFAHDAAELLRSGLVHFFQLRTMGGAIADVAPEATAFAHRSADFQVTAMGSSDDRLSARWRELGPHFDGLYLSFETDRSTERLTEAFPRPTLERLRALKRAYDPTNLFRDNFNIAPDDPAAEAGQGEAA